MENLSDNSSSQGDTGGAGKDTERPEIYRKSVLHLPRHKFAVYLSRCCTDLR